jgi:hypothetical protein
MKCICPRPTALPTIPSVASAGCGGAVKIDQVVRLIFVRAQASNATLFPTGGGSPKPIATKASWTPYFTAVDDTKMAVTPLFAGMVIPQSEGQEEGADDNSAILGIPTDLGESAVKATGEFRNMPAEVKVEMDKLRCESQISNGINVLQVFMVNKDGYLIHTKNSAGEPVGFPIYNFRISSRGTEGLKSDDKNGFSFYFASDWDDKITFTTPSGWSPLTEI